MQLQDSLVLIRKQLTLREYRGYLKGRILECRFQVSVDMSPLEITDILSLSQELETELMKLGE